MTGALARAGMPWIESRVVDLREKFVLAAMEPGARMAELSREYGISRKTAYKWLKRFKERGSEGLLNMSRRPHRYESTKGELVLGVIEARGRYPHWGTQKAPDRCMTRQYGETPFDEDDRAYLEASWRAVAAEAASGVGGATYDGRCARTGCQSCELAMDGGLQRLVAHRRSATVRAVDRAGCIQPLHFYDKAIGERPRGSGSAGIRRAVPEAWDAREHSNGQWVAVRLNEGAGWADDVECLVGVVGDSPRFAVAPPIRKTTVHTSGHTETSPKRSRQGHVRHCGIAAGSVIRCLAAGV